jgi:hypothetical protein
VRRGIETLNARHGVAARLEEPRLDLAPLLRSADVVVATATTALEALACGTPVVAAGRTGYVGPVSTGTFDAARCVLFGDHGRCARPVRAEHLVEGIAEVLGNLEHWRAEAGALATEISSHYTMGDAAADMLGVYERVLARAGVGATMAPPGGTGVPACADEDHTGTEAGATEGRGRPGETPGPQGAEGPAPPPSAHPE